MAQAQREERIKMTDAAMQARMFIAGGWTAAASGATSMAASPATGESLGPVPEGDREDARRALDAAALAFPSWSGASPFDRARLLHRIGEVCDRRADELARMLTLDQGKPLRAEAYDEVHELIAFWHLAAEDAVRLEGMIPPSSSSDKRVLVMRRARGPIGVITPWNWPYTSPIDRRLLRPAGRVRCRGRPSGGGVQLRDRTWTGGGRRDRRKPGDGRSGLHRLDPNRPPRGAARGREGTAARNGGQRPARRNGRRGPRVGRRGDDRRLLPLRRPELHGEREAPGPQERP